MNNFQKIQFSLPSSKAFLISSISNCNVNRRWFVWYRVPLTTCYIVVYIWDSTLKIKKKYPASITFQYCNSFETEIKINYCIFKSKFNIKFWAMHNNLNLQSKALICKWMHRYYKFLYTSTKSLRCLKYHRLDEI